jgi:hypothetical protein
LTRRDLTRLLLKIFGVIILVSVVAGLPSGIYGFVLYLSALDRTHAIHTWQDIAFIGGSYFGPSVAYTAAGLCFLGLSGYTVDRASLAPERGESESVVELLDLRNVELSLIAALGLYIFADGFAELCRVGLGLGLRYATDGSPSLFWHLDLLFFAEALIKLLIGISLVLGRGWTVAALRSARVWVRKLRSCGLRSLRLRSLAV